MPQVRKKEPNGHSRRPALAGALSVALLLVSMVVPECAARGLEAGSEAGDTRSAEELQRRGLELLRAREYEAALPLLEEAVRLEPENLETAMARVTALRRLGRHDDARAFLTEARTRFPESQQPVVSMGYLERALGRLDESVYWFHRGADMEGGWYNDIRLAVTYTDLGDLERMANAARRLALSPYGEALGRTLEHLFRSEFDATLEIVETQLENSDDELWLSLAAAIAVLVGDDSRALEHYRVLAPELFGDELSVTPANATEGLWLAFVLDRSGEKDRAAELVRAVLVVLGPDASGYELPLRKVYRSAAYLLLGNVETALAHFRSAVDHGYRSILFERTVRFEEFEMFAPLNERAEFRGMLAEIRDDNRRMLARVRSAEAGPAPTAPPSR
ncbi:MAG: tetratricopeptide repeat protein [Thermoanaerobaculia bacterium]